jgi:hypothetical protein
MRPLQLGLAVAAGILFTTLFAFDGVVRLA